MLCNGSAAAQSAGAPNLVDKFVVGRGSAYAAGATGGKTDATLVAHDHNFSANGTNTHSHTLPQGRGGSQASINGYLYGFTVEQIQTPQYSTTEASITISMSGTTDNVGVGSTGANLPPYYAIAYIMRVS